MNKPAKIRYPWKRWLSRKRFALQRGVDYYGQTHSMAQQVRNAALRHNKRVSIRIIEGLIQVEVYDAQN